MSMKLEMRLVKRQLYGVNFEVDADSIRPEEQCIIRWRDWEHDKTRFWLMLCGRAKIVVDVGASFGWYTCLAARNIGRKGRVYSYEPNPVLYRRLQRNVALNGLGNVVLRPVAASDREGIGYTSPSEKYQNVWFKPRVAHYKSEILASMIPIRTVILDKDLAGKTVDLVKIDVEGHEMNVLKGMEQILRRSRHIRVIIEVHVEGLKMYGSSVKELREWLSARGFILSGWLIKKKR